MTTHLRNIRLSRLNSGAVRHINHHRGSTTFATVADFTYSAKNQVAEVGVSGSVPDIQSRALRVERRVGTQTATLDI